MIIHNRFHSYRLVMLIILSLLWTQHDGHAANMTGFLWAVDQTPWRVSGTAGYSFVAGLAKGQKPVRSDTHRATLSVAKGYRGFFWRPWMFRWDGDSRVSVGWAKIVARDANTPKEGKRKTHEVSLQRDLAQNLNIDLFPESHYPMHIGNRVQYGDTSENKEVGGGNYSSVNNIKQQYTSQDGMIRGDVQWERMRTRMGDRERRGVLQRVLPYFLPGIYHYQSETKKDTLDFNFSQRLESQNISVTGTSSKEVARDDNTYRTTTRDTSMVVQHTFTPSGFLSLNNMANAGRNRIHHVSYPYIPSITDNSSLFEPVRSAQDDATTETQTNVHWYQVNSTAFMRTDESPLSLSATSRAYYATNTSWNGVKKPDDPLQSTHGDKTNMVSTDIGLAAQYQFTPHFTGSLNLNGDAVRNKQYPKPDRNYRSQVQWDRNATQYLSLNYTPESHDLGYFRYGWSTNGTYGVNFARDVKLVQTAGEQIGHNIGRMISLTPTSTLEFSLSEAVNASHVQHTITEKAVNHGVTARWSNDAENNRTYVSATANDVHYWGEAKGQTQFMNLQLSRSGSLENGLAWNGDATIQWSRAKPFGEDSSIQRSASINISVRKPNFFDIPNMNATTSLTMTTPGMFPVFSPGEEEGLAWDGQLDYQIGMMQMSLKATYQSLNNELSGENHFHGFFLEISRFFDKTF